MYRQTDDKKFIKLSSGLRNIDVHISLKTAQRRSTSSTKTNRMLAEKSSSSEVQRTVNNDIEHRKDERNSIEMSFFSNCGFINPDDILPLPENLRPSPTDKNTASQDTVPGENPDELHRPLEQPEQPREKKVTFMFEGTGTGPIPPSKGAGLTAPIRRQNFRNSYSKGSKSTANDDETIPLQTPDLVVPSDTAPAAVHIPETSVGVSDNAAPMPATKRIVSANIDRVKLGTTKRKLKSCRSRSFHKSLDSSMVFQQTTRAPFSYKKPLKAAHPEVVTMISLEGSQSEENEKNDTKTENIAPKIQSFMPAEDSKKDVNSDRECLPSVLLKSRTPDHHSPTVGIIEFAGSMTGGAAFTQLNLEQRRNIYASTKSTKFLSISSSKEPASIHQNTLLMRKVVQTKSLESGNIKSKYVNQENQSFLRYVPLQSTKEQECWSSFHKMNKKGLFVSFDTILRGLLTPTEYRQRKDNLDFIAPEVSN